MTPTLNQVIFGICAYILIARWVGHTYFLLGAIGQHENGSYKISSSIPAWAVGALWPAAFLLSLTQAMIKFMLRGLFW